MTPIDCEICHIDDYIHRQKHPDKTWVKCDFNHNYRYAISYVEADGGPMHYIQLY